MANKIFVRTKVEITGGKWAGNIGEVTQCNYDADLYRIAIRKIKVFEWIEFENLRIL